MRLVEFVMSPGGGYLSVLSSRYSIIALVSWLMLLRHELCLAFSLALTNTGKRIAARIAIIAITTNSSINVNPLFSLHIFADLPRHSGNALVHRTLSLPKTTFVTATLREESSESSTYSKLAEL
jgi:hypothetical protein